MAKEPTYEELEQRVKELEKQAVVCRQVEKALTESENRYRTLLENLPQQIFHKDRDSVYVSCNENYARALKIKPEEIVGKTDYDFFPEKLAEKYRADDRRIMASAKTEELEDKYLQDEEEAWVRTVKTPIIGEKGSITGILGIFGNITERKRTEEALQQRTHHLGKRVRELTCLYGISHLIAKQGITLEEILRGTLDLISGSWQYPEITCARINLEGQDFKTDNFAETIWKQAADIAVGDDRIGTLEVCYLEQKPESDDGPFLKEERNLLNAITERLGKIVKRTRTEEALRFERDNLVSILNSMEDGVYIVDQQYTIEYANPSFREEFGPPERKKCYEHFYGRKVPCPWCKNQDVLGGRSAHWERYFQRTKKIYDILDTPLKKPDGTTSKLSILRDITSTKQVQEQLKHTTEQLSVLLESLPIVLYSSKAGEDFGITYISGSVERITGYSPGHFTEDATFWTKHIHPDDQDAVLAELPAQLMRDKHQLEYRFRIADGSYIWFVDTWRVVQLPDGAISHVVGIWQDVTEEKKIAQQAEYRLQQIVQTDRLASLGKVVAGVAHEINNPNSFITYNIPLLEETWQIFEPLLTDYVTSHPEWRKSNMTINELCQDMSEIIQAIRIGSERINKVVSNLKDFARLDESAYAKPVKVNEVVEKTLSIVGSQVSKYITRPELNLPSNLPEIQGHAQKLEQVVANLVVNAVYAIPDKETGRLSITTRYIERLKSVLIEIEDNGTGMKPSVVKRIFEPFFTTRRDVGGTGLGLSVSYGLIQEHNGIIGVLSRPGLGTRFTVFLPVDRDTELDIRPSILCVDDDVGFLSEVKMYFLDVKHMSFETTSNPDSVMAYLEEHPETDIVLADIMMPGINGWELLEKIKARFPLLTVILCTGYPSALKQKPYGGPEPDHLFKKPFKMEHLLELINAIGRQRL
jgi:PAS domain S-box-containing protein